MNPDTRRRIIIAAFLAFVVAVWAGVVTGSYRAGAAQCEVMK